MALALASAGAAESVDEAVLRAFCAGECSAQAARLAEREPLALPARSYAALCRAESREQAAPVVSQLLALSAGRADCPARAMGPDELLARLLPRGQSAEPIVEAALVSLPAAAIDPASFAALEAAKFKPRAPADAPGPSETRPAAGSGGRAASAPASLPKGLSISEVPSHAPAPDEAALRGEARLATLARLEAAAAAGAQLWPVSGVMRPQHAALRRERLGLEAAREERDWRAQGVERRSLDDSETGRAERALLSRLAQLRDEQAGVEARLERALSKRPEYARWKLLDDSSSLSAGQQAERDALAEALQRDPEYRQALSASDALSREGADSRARLAALESRDPRYFKAQAARAELVLHNRERLGDFAQGTQFAPEELGLPADAGAARKSTVEGAAGIETRDAQGLLHFQTLDGTARYDELPGGESRLISGLALRDGRIVTTIHERPARREKDEVAGILAGAQLKKAVHYDRLEDGSFVRREAGRDWPRAIGRFGAEGFAAVRIEREDGSVEEPAGKEAAGVWVVRDRTGRASQWSVGGGSLAKGGPSERRERIAGLAQWLTRQRGLAGAEGQYHADSLAAMLEDFLDPAEQSELVLMSDGKVVIQIQRADGLGVQVVGMMEPTLSGWGDGVHFKLVPPVGRQRGMKKMAAGKGLMAYARAVRPGKDQDKEFIRVRQYLGKWGAETMVMTAHTNTERWYWWITGASTWSVPVVRRLYRKAGAGGRVVWEDQGHRIDKEEIVLYAAPNLLAATLQAVGTAGRGAADLVSGGLAFVAANTPAYYALVEWTGGDVGFARKDMLDRAYTNFFGNAIVREYVSPETLERIGVNDEVYIQNVGAEMSSMGHHATGAVLQGGVNFANNMLPMAGTIKGLQGISRLGNAGRLLTGGAAVAMTAHAGHKLGSAIDQFGVAWADYDENDPASRARYYQSLENLTEHGLNAPVLFAGSRQLVRRLSMRGAPSVEPASIPAWAARTPGGRWIAREFGLVGPEPVPVVPPRIAANAPANPAPAPPAPAPAPALGPPAPNPPPAPAALSAAPPSPAPVPPPLPEPKPAPSAREAAHELRAADNRLTQLQKDLKSKQSKLKRELPETTRESVLKNVKTIEESIEAVRLQRDTALAAMAQAQRLRWEQLSREPAPADSKLEFVEDTNLPRALVDIVAGGKPGAKWTELSKTALQCEAFLNGLGAGRGRIRMLEVNRAELGEDFAAFRRLWKGEPAKLRLLDQIEARIETVSPRHAESSPAYCEAHRIIEQSGVGKGDHAAGSGKHLPDVKALTQTVLEGLTLRTADKGMAAPLHQLVARNGGKLTVHGESGAPIELQVRALGDGLLEVSVMGSAGRFSGRIKTIETAPSAPAAESEIPLHLRKPSGR